MSDPLLLIRNLAVRYSDEAPVLEAVSLTVRQGEIYGLVGESGSGKTTLAMAVLGLIDPPGVVEAGIIEFEGLDLLRLTEDELDLVRGSKIGIVFQNAGESLNPTFTVGYQLAEMLEVHLGVKRREAKQQSAKWLDRIGLSGFAASYPHQLSGGQAQRAMTAIALAPEPALLIADEPTSALDVTLQAQILELIQGLAREQGTTVLWITHDLAVIATVAERVGVLYGGRIVEEVPVKQLFAEPSHPFTRKLMAAAQNTRSSTG